MPGEQPVTFKAKNINDDLVLSIFPGIDLLGQAFEGEGFCVVRGPDIITGNDIRNFFPPKNKFNGVVAGSPCQDWSMLNRNPTSYSDEMLNEFVRVVKQSNVYWFLYENVVTAPHFDVGGYYTQRFTLDLSWFSNYTRRRDFVFGCLDEIYLNPIYGRPKEIKGKCVTGSDSRSFRQCCQIHGLEDSFDLPFFNNQSKKQAIANSVPLSMGRYVANLIVNTLYNSPVKPIQFTSSNHCQCGCKRPVTGRQKYFNSSCRKRAERLRKKTA